MLSFVITNQDHCRRLESYLRTLMPTSPFGYARKLIKSGAAKLNGAQATADNLLSLHDTVTLKESAATAAQLTPVRPELDILYEDGHVLIANKPPGLPMHRTAEFEDNLVDYGQAYMIQRATPCKLYPVNRLDRGTSGTVIMAKSSSSAAIYGRQVKETGLDKLYLALVWGTPESSGVIKEALDGKESETRYKILLAGENCSLLAVTPISGRMHQIRRHLSSIGRPVVGDKRYGGGDLPELSGFALHSFRTTFALAESGELTVCAPLSDELLNLCERRGIGQNTLLETVYKLALQEEP
ncbi:MAG: RluA family pseudouridine synthase [Geobacteraceae bacterium]|nr:RluA family pseudouridine synthase [Geobacteraceae bacterium]NTW81670.1 RluA family pseudouridine synthase [Geobacteraceae bacterium]